ncbi:MAG: hypothetical protein AB7T08_15570, partial [Hyphomonadaceae bacterium]
DLHDAPLTDAASDAAWLAASLNTSLYDMAATYYRFGADEGDMQTSLHHSAEFVLADFSRHADPDHLERWRLPTASVLTISEYEGEVVGIDLGDCRCFALDAANASHAVGGPPQAADQESKRAAVAATKAGDTPLLKHADTLDYLRGVRAKHNTTDGYWVFGLNPDCAFHARAWRLNLARPAHILLCTDGFSALVDRYEAYDAAGLVNAAREKGLQALGGELREIESQDASSAKHPRWKRSDDATALLLRLT